VQYVQIPLALALALALAVPVPVPVPVQIPRTGPHRSWFTGWAQKIGSAAVMTCKCWVAREAGAGGRTAVIVAPSRRQGLTYNLRRSCVPAMAASWAVRLMAGPPTRFTNNGRKFKPGRAKRRG
jgi:hypothetical protein